MHASSGAEARLRASSSEFAAHARRPRARAHAPGGGRAGSRRGIRTRRRMQAGMDTCGLAHASEAAPGRQQRRQARRRALAASPGSRRNLALRVPISPIGLSQFWAAAGVQKPPCFCTVRAWYRDCNLEPSCKEEAWLTEPPARGMLSTDVVTLPCQYMMRRFLPFSGRILTPDVCAQVLSPMPPPHCIGAA